MPSQSFIRRSKKSLKNFRRWIYGLRAYIPGLREQHRIEVMVGPVGHWKELGRYQFRLLEQNGLRRHHRLLDLGCGPLQGGVPFIRFLDVSNYTGVDINPKHLEAARGQVSRHKLDEKTPRLAQSAVFGDDVFSSESFDFIWASQILYYFPDSQLSELFAFVRKRLNPKGKFLADFINPDQFDAIVYPGCNFIRHSLKDLETMAGAQGLQARYLGEILKYGYPPRFHLRSNILMEFSLKE